MGSEEHLLPVAIDHAVNHHGHERTAELEEAVKGMIIDAPQD